MKLSELVARELSKAPTMPQPAPTLARRVDSLESFLREEREQPLRNALKDAGISDAARQDVALSLIQGEPNTRAAIERLPAWLSGRAAEPAATSGSESSGPAAEV